MIKANELRIGNTLLVFGTNGNPDKWAEISINADHIVTCSSNPELFKPIPLTEDRLVRFGFKQYSIDGKWYPTWRSFLPIYRRGKYFGFNGLGLSVREFEYVHQLQNLFYCLVGEELTINPRVLFNPL